MKYVFFTGIGESGGSGGDGIFVSKLENFIWGNAG